MLFTIEEHSVLTYHLGWDPWRRSWYPISNTMVPQLLQTFQGYLQRNAAPWACHHDIADCKLTATLPGVVQAHLDKQCEIVHRLKPVLWTILQHQASTSPTHTQNAHSDEWTLIIKRFKCTSWFAISWTRSFAQYWGSGTDHLVRLSQHQQIMMQTKADI